MNKLYFPNFNHKITLLGGQSFSWDLIDENKYIGVTDSTVVKLKVEGDYIFWQTYPQNNNVDFINQYFQIDLDYERIIKAIVKDKYINKAFEHYGNIRILKQPVVYTILTFIISANNSIKSIRKSVRALAKLYGKPIKVSGVGTINLFPSLEILAMLSEEQIRKTKVGFRAKYIKQTAMRLLKEKSVLELQDEDKLRSFLISLPGVGNKIADCVLGYGLGFKNVTAIDVWGKRILVDLYRLPNHWKYEDYRIWTKKNFFGYATYAGQYLFEWYRNKDKLI